MESLLNVCKQSYETKRLRWHYRSRHESLIAVSNQEFYDGNLMVFPSPMHETPDLGLSFVYLPDTVYERGKTGVNRGEARAVAEAVIEYYRRFPDKTLGVATFSTRQQEVIRHEVELLLRENPDVESLMRPENGENFFVKNLETVQGDERDTMLISIGYGFDENHKLSRNFGPLNQDGGERRLNVLITRARERCVVFANFRGSDLAVEPGSASGISALATFLTYAADRSTPLGAGGEAPDDVAGLFGDTIARLLEDNGYHVAQNVGLTLPLRIRMSLVCTLPEFSATARTTGPRRLPAIVTGSGYRCWRDSAGILSGSGQPSGTSTPRPAPRRTSTPRPAPRRCSMQLRLQNQHQRKNLPPR